MRLIKTIKSSKEISEIFKTGKRLSNKYLICIFINLESKYHGQNGRVAFIAGKKYGNAIWRNSAKRRLREIYKDIGGPLPNIDILLIAKKQLTQENYNNVVRECKKLRFI